MGTARGVEIELTYRRGTHLTARARCVHAEQEKHPEGKEANGLLSSDQLIYEVFRDAIAINLYMLNGKSTAKYEGACAGVTR